MLYQSLFAVAGLATTALAHGVVTSPPIRTVGKAMTAACGKAVSDLAAVDVNDHVEGLPELAATTANFDAAACNVFLCRGMQFEDNTANVQTFAPGQVVNMLASLPILHEGPMNVSVIDTKTNTAIGDPLISFDSYADESLAQIPANNTDFDVTIPTTLGTACAVAGDCVLQWFWFGTGADQTYESCVDMVVADSAANTVVSPANAVVASPVASPATESSAPAVVAVADPIPSAVASPVGDVLSVPVSIPAATPAKASKASKANKKGKKVAQTSSAAGAASTPPASVAAVNSAATGCNTKRTIKVFKAKKFKA